jgi:hypothetical protein
MTDPKLSQLTRDGNFSLKVAAILDEVAHHGYPDVYIAEAKRTLAQQLEKIRLGYSKTRLSYHLKRGSDGGGKAADVVPRKTLWNAEKRYWLMLGYCAYNHGVGWGGLFGVSTLQKARILSAMKQLSAKGWPHDDELYRVQIGWDGAHLQSGSNW